MAAAPAGYVQIPVPPAVEAEFVQVYQRLVEIAIRNSATRKPDLENPEVVSLMGQLLEGMQILKQEWGVEVEDFQLEPVLPASGGGRVAGVVVFVRESALANQLRAAAQANDGAAAPALPPVFGVGNGAAFPANLTAGSGGDGRVTASDCPPGVLTYPFATAAQPQGNGGSNGSLSTGALAGVIVGSISGLAFLVLLILFLMRAIAASDQLL